MAFVATSIDFRTVLYLQTTFKSLLLLTAFKSTFDASLKFEVGTVALTKVASWRVSLPFN